MAVFVKNLIHRPQKEKMHDKKMHDMTPLNQLKVHHEVTGPQ